MLEMQLIKKFKLLSLCFPSRVTINMNKGVIFMKTILFILPALQEVLSAKFRQIKYSLFPPLSLLTLAGLVSPDKYNLIVRDEHVEDIFIDEPVDLVVMTVYISSAKRAYEISKYYRERGSKIFMGGIHPSTMEEEVMLHADSICIGPGESVFLQMLSDFEGNKLRGKFITEINILISLKCLWQEGI